MKAYEVVRCNLDGFKNWSGTVIDTEEKGVSEAIKKKFGLDSLYCEEFPNKKLQECGENQFGYSEISVESVHLQNLTVGELLGILRHNIEVDKRAVAEARKRGKWRYGNDIV